MKNALRIIEMGPLKDFQGAFGDPKPFINNVFKNSIGIFNGTLFPKKLQLLNLLAYFLTIQ
jgi:hypothetical protein